MHAMCIHEEMRECNLLAILSINNNTNNNKTNNK